MYLEKKISCPAFFYSLIKKKARSQLKNIESEY